MRWPWSRQTYRVLVTFSNGVVMWGRVDRSGVTVAEITELTIVYSRQGRGFWNVDRAPEVILHPREGGGIPLQGPQAFASFPGLLDLIDDCAPDP